MSVLTFRARADLIFTARSTVSGRDWIVEDPLTLRFFRIGCEERFILEELNGRRSLSEIQQRFELQFPPKRLTLLRLNSFLLHLHSQGLLLSDRPGQGAVMEQRRYEENTRRRWAYCTNLLAVRLPGIAAQRWIDRLYPFGKWLLRPGVLLLAGLLIISAIGLVALEFTTMRQGLPSLVSLFHPSTWPYFLIAVVLSKTLHELGHALVNRHFGARCHEIGVMFLIGIPTLYCDVTDAWRLPHAWQRALVAAAGIGVDLVLAAIATWVWWLSSPGIVNLIAFRILLLCSVNSLLFNGNPLVRCDGYYLLSDLTQIPNLWQEARQLWADCFYEWFTARKLRSNHLFAPHTRWAMMAYAAASFLYRIALTAGILWFLFKLLEPHGLALIAGLFVLITVVGMNLPAIRQLFRWYQEPGSRPPLRLKRLIAISLVALALTAAVFSIPLPHRVAAPFVLEPDQGRSIYVSVPGQLRSALSEFATVQTGEVVATLENPSLQQQVSTLEAELAQNQSKLQVLRRLLTEDPSASPLLPAAEKALGDVRQRLEICRQELAKLTIRAPQGGRLMAPLERIHPQVEPEHLVGWQGLPLDPANRNAFMESGDLLGILIDPSKVVAHLYLHQADIQDIRVGQEVRLRLHQSPPKLISGTVCELAKTSSESLPVPIAQALNLRVRNGFAERHALSAVFYQAKVTVSSGDTDWASGIEGDAVIYTHWVPIGQRILDAIRRIFTI
jgi:putative peptide zinc metalloprotease protein